MESIRKIKPKIRKLTFENKGKISIHLLDGRTLIVPLTNFPSIKKLSLSERLKYTIVNDQMILFKNCNEVFHLQDFLGVEQKYVYAG